MNYAIIDDGVVTNTIWLTESNAPEFPEAVKIGDRPVAVGDSLIDGKFYRDGVEILSPLEEKELENADMRNALNELGVYVNG